MDQDDRGRVAVVTGAGRGLGRGVAVALAGRGHPVVGVARNAAQLAETADIIRAAGGRMVARPADVSDPAAVAAMATFVREQMGSPSILVNAAGTFGPIALIRDTDPAAWVQTIMIDAVAPYLTIRAFLGGLREAFPRAESPDRLSGRAGPRRDAHRAPSASRERGGEGRGDLGARETKAEGLLAGVCWFCVA